MVQQLTTDQSPVFNPARAATYLGLKALGVAKPVERIKYLVKTKKLKSINILGHMGFLRDDLDRFLADCQQERN